MSTTAKSALRKAGLFYFVWVMFSYCTGGPFGLEDMVTTSGPGMTLIFLLVIPFFWCIPVSLVSAELTTAMPVEGGFYRWVRAGFGDFWGFLAGWWNWCASFLLGSVYAVQFADYLGYYFPEIAGWRHYIVSLAIVAVITYINVRGIQMVGKFATVLELFILLPVLVLVVIGLAKWHHNPFVPVIPPHQPTFHVFGVGLALRLREVKGFNASAPASMATDAFTASSRTGWGCPGHGRGRTCGTIMIGPSTTTGPMRCSWISVGWANAGGMPNAAPRAKRPVSLRIFRMARAPESVYTGIDIPGRSAATRESDA